MTDTTTTAIIAPARRAVWRYVGGLAPVVLLWAGLAGWLAFELANRAQWSDRADAATISEWLSETRTFRQSLPEMVHDYAGMEDGPLRRSKHNEIEEQMRALVEPTRMFPNQLPAFPEIFSLSVEGIDDTLAWTSPVARPDSARRVVLPIRGYPGTAITCDFRMHAFNRLQQEESQRRHIYGVVGVLLVTATVLAALFVSRFLRREHQREIERLTAIADKEHRERDLFKARLDNEETERAAGLLHRRAIEAEKNALEVKSQIHASIGIMAGSYAHNIKNLLVRPNDLLARCLENPGPQEAMLVEVKQTLGTVTERLQQILRTVRRDPQQSQTERLDLNELVRDTTAAWRETALDKWKLQIDATIDHAEIPIVGDISHLQQALENLLFNARDATFEMRNRLREQARESSGDDRKAKLLAAAAWKGTVTLTVRAGPILEICDNGIGMTEDVKANCLAAHFTTKRDNALYEGYTAGMGLGLSFVAMVLQQHGATLEIDTAPNQGACFRVLFPNAA